jgi:RNA polymerase-binding transcription factor DksA
MNFSTRPHWSWRFKTLDREHNLLRDAKSALLRIHGGSFGTCIQCDWSISPKRLAAGAGRRFGSSARRLRTAITESPIGTLVKAA